MSSMINTSKRTLFHVNVCDSTPSPTQYSPIQTTFQPKLNSRNSGFSNQRTTFSKTTRNDHLSYLKVNKNDLFNPKPTSYDPNIAGTFGNGGGAGGGNDGVKPITLQNHQGKERWEKVHAIKENYGPALFDASNPKYSSVVTKNARSYTFRKSNATNHEASTSKIAPGPCEYDPMMTRMGSKSLGNNTRSGQMDVIRNSIKGYKTTNFGSVTRFERRDIAVKDKIALKYVKPMVASSTRNDDVKQHSTFAKSPQFQTFTNTPTDVPGPGSYDPPLPTKKKTGNVKLGHMLPVKGGRGVDGVAVGDDDCYQRPEELIGASLVTDCGGDGGIDGEMRVYRRNIEKLLKKKGKIVSGKSGGSKVEEDEGEMEEMQFMLFHSNDTPAFPSSSTGSSNMSTSRNKNRSSN